MARGRDPALPLYADEFTRDTRVQSLPRELRGPLVHLWCIAWMEGPISDDRVRGVSRLIDATEDETRDLLAQFFTRTKAGWISRRLEDERSQRMKHRERQRESGKRGAAQRWGRHGDPNGDPMASGHPDPIGDAMAAGDGVATGSPMRSDGPLPHTLPHTRTHDTHREKDSPSGSEAPVGGVVRTTRGTA